MDFSCIFKNVIVIFIISLLSYIWYKHEHILLKNLILEETIEIRMFFLGSGSGWRISESRIRIVIHTDPHHCLYDDYSRNFWFEKRNKLPGVVSYPRIQRPAAGPVIVPGSQTGSK